jgi:predicted PurR-regulated permease PerM
MRILLLIIGLFCCSSCGQVKQLNTNMENSTENLKKNTATVQNSSEVISKNTQEVARSTLNMRIFGIIGLIALIVIASIVFVFYKRHRRLLHDIKFLVDRIKKE